MKFHTDSLVSCIARNGTLSEFERMPNAIFKTPLTLIYTKGGCIPHLTKDVWKALTSEQQILSVSLPSTITMKEHIKEVNRSFAEFVSMKEYINFLSIQDPAYATIPGYQKNASISVWSKIGRHTLTADKYMDIVESFKPDFYVALCDGDTNTDSSKKRVTKAVERSNNLLQQCLSRHSSSEVLKSKGILAAVEGGYDLQARERSITHIKDKPVTGFVIDGLHCNGPDVKDISSDQVMSVVKHTLGLLPVEKLKVAMGCWNPVTVLDLISIGVDIFDSSYAYTATECKEALTFLCDDQTCNKAAFISIMEEQYKEDFSPICSKCECLTCTNHTRAYLHHLHHTKEMLGLVLLTIHNIHHYLLFFESIREHVKNGSLPQLRTTISTKFSKTNGHLARE